MDYSQIINSILVMGVLIFAGLVISKLNILTEEGAASINGIIMKLVYPAAILMSMQRSFSSELFKNSMGLIALSAGIYAVLIIIVTFAGKASRLPADKLKIMQFMMVFGNVASMGFPLADAVYGDTGVFYASCFNLLYNLLVFSYGVMLLDKGGKGVDLLKLINPGLVATVIGLAFFMTSFKLPHLLCRPMELLGDMLVPLSLLTVGNSLSKMKFGDLLKEPLVWKYSVQRLVVLPCTIMLVLKLIGLNNYLLVIPVIIMATPAPLAGGVFARTYGGDELLANKSIVLSNFLAIITVPAIVFLIGSGIF
jgi:malate permease and related proteins